MATSRDGSGANGATGPGGAAAEGLRRHEKATLAYSYVGETGRGVFQALAIDFAMLVAVSHFFVSNRWLLWVLGAAPFIGYVASLFSAPLSRHWRKKSLVRTLEVASRIFMIGAACALTGSAFVMLMGIGIACAFFGTPLVSGIYGANFRTQVRGGAVGRLHTLRMAAVAATGALIGVVMGWDTAFYRPLLGGLSMLALGCAWFSWRLPESRRRRNNGTANQLSDVGRVLTGDKAFLWLEVCWFLFGISNLQMVPMKVLYLRDLGFGEQQIMLCTTTAMFATMVVSIRLWGMFLYRVNFGIYRIAANLFIMIGIGIFFRSSSPWTAALGSAFWAFGLAGGSLSWRLIATFFTSADRGPAYMSVHTFLCGLRGMAGPMFSLHSYGTLSAQTLSTISLFGFSLSSLLLIPLIPTLSKREKN